MKRATSIGTALCVSATLMTLTTVVHAAAGRTFVSGAGSDANTATNCPRTTPCRTLAMALTVTAAGGEIIALDPAGYGAITLTGTFTLVGVPGAEITPPANGTGVTVNSGAGNTVTIDTFQITSDGQNNTTGIGVTSGNVVVRNSSLKYLTVGMNVGNENTPVRADLINTDIIGVGTAINTFGAGVPYNTGIGIYASNACAPPPAALCATIVRINGGSIVDTATAFLETDPTSTSGHPSAVVWFVNTFIFGVTTVMTTSGVGNGTAPGPQGLILNGQSQPY